MVAGVIGAEEARAGTRTLALLAAPLSAAVLDRLAEGPRRLAELRRETGSPQTTLRARLKELNDVGAVARRRLHPLPGVREHVLVAGAGIELRFVAATLRGWLATAPAGPLEPDGDLARAALKALLDAWAAGLVRAVAERPHTLTEFDAAIEGISRQSLERRLAAARAAGLVEETGGTEEGPAYTASEWLRRAAAPIATAARWERKHLAQASPPIAPTDAEAGFLLAIPLLALPAEVSGSCRLAVEFDEGGEDRLAGVTVRAEAGRVVSCIPRLESGPSAWASGPPPAWLRVAIEADPNRLQLGGDTRLARVLLDGLNRTLFPPRLI